MTMTTTITVMMTMTTTKVMTIMMLLMTKVMTIMSLERFEVNNYKPATRHDEIGGIFVDEKDPLFCVLCLLGHKTRT